MLARQVFYHLSYISSLFSLTCFSDRVLFFPQHAWTVRSSYLQLPIARMTDVNHYAWLVCWDEGLPNFLPQVSLNCNPPSLSLLSSWDYRYQSHAWPVYYTFNFLLWSFLPCTICLPWWFLLIEHMYKWWCMCVLCASVTGCGWKFYRTPAPPEL
jgi:hypothetical protein